MRGLFIHYRIFYWNSLTIDVRDATIHNLDVLIYCHLCITIQ